MWDRRDDFFTLKLEISSRGESNSGPQGAVEATYSTRLGTLLAWLAKCNSPYETHVSSQCGRAPMVTCSQITPVLHRRLRCGCLVGRSIIKVFLKKMVGFDVE